MNKGDIFKIKQDDNSIRELMLDTGFSFSQAIEVSNENLECYSTSNSPFNKNVYIIFVFKGKYRCILESITELVTDKHIGHPLTKVFK